LSTFYLPNVYVSILSDFDVYRKQFLSSVVNNARDPPVSLFYTYKKGDTMNDLRTAIREEVESIRPLDKLEEAHIQDILTWIDSGADLFRIKKPDVPNKHLVSYFVVIDPIHKSVLLVDHIKAQKWLPTGGHVLLNEHPKQAVIREADEELRMKATFLRGNTQPLFATVTKTGGLTPGHTDVSLWYVLRANKHDFIHYDKIEFTDIEWFTFDEILESDPVIFDPHFRRFIDKLATYLK
jgi:8-oxo-dGTP pyrophosphatase MutT (NUDIX family)